MKQLIFFIFLSLCFSKMQGQDIISALSEPGSVQIAAIDAPIEKIPVEIYIKYYVEDKISEWQKKGEFEKTKDYQLRVNENARKMKAQDFANDGLTEYKQKYAKTINLKNLQLGSYDADNETFLIHSDRFGDFALSVEISTAPSFKKNWNEIIIQNINLDVNSREVQLSKLEFVNPALNKTYVYDSKQSSTYTFDDIQYNFGSLDYKVDLAENNEPSNTTIVNRNSTFGVSDVDIDIPVSGTKNPNAYALIIGNEDYKSYQTGLHTEQNVYFAINDAQIFKKYCEETLGIPRDNIIYVTNAGLVRMTQSINQIQSVIKNSGGDAEIIFYYAGHGFPDEITKEPYLIPVDVTGSNLDMAISLKEVYRKLTEFNSKKVIIFLDACFTGGGRDAGLLAARSISIKPKEQILIGNIVVFTASSGEQSSLPYTEKQHGLFTYYLLKKLQESQGQINLEELGTYIEKKVSIRSPLINAKEQNPQILVSPTVSDSWQSWELK